MNTLEAIYKRRSIRRYTTERVKEEDIETILKAGMAAPSAHNTHPCYFIILRSREILDCIGKQYVYHQMLLRANAAIVICADPALMHHETDVYIADDCSAAAENMLLAALELGIGAVWLGMHGSQEFVDNLRTWLGIPRGIFVHSVISLGYPQGELKTLNRDQPERIFRDHWGK